MGEAWTVTALGEPAAVLVRGEVGEPTVGPGQVAVRVRVASVNFPDLLLCQGAYHHKPRLPFGLGSEAAGEVVAAGEGAGQAPGARVLVAPMSYGCFATHVVVDAASALPVPDSMGFEDAACLFLTYQTAWIGLHRRVRLAPGERVLVLGASGGVGTAAIQVARGAGATVVAAASTPAKAALCQEIGAHHVVDLSRQDLYETVRTATGGAGVDVVVDPVGGPLFEPATRLLAVEGRYLVVGFASGAVPKARLNHTLIKNYALVGFRLQPFREDLAYAASVHAALVELYAQGVVAPVVRERFSFDQVPAAVARLGTRGVVGKVVVLGP